MGCFFACRVPRVPCVCTCRDSPDGPRAAAYQEVFKKGRKVRPRRAPPLRTRVPCGACHSTINVARCSLATSQVVLAGAGHACYMEKPDEFHAELLAWLSEQK